MHDVVEHIESYVEATFLDGVARNIFTYDQGKAAIREAAPIASGNANISHLLKIGATAIDAEPTDLAKIAQGLREDYESDYTLSGLQKHLLRDVGIQKSLAMRMLYANTILMYFKK